MNSNNEETILNSDKENILVSACFLGINCRYDGKSVKLNSIDRLKEKYNLIPICPEELGGLSTPRDPAERKDGKVLDINGQDVTDFFESGANKTLQLARFFNCRYAILKEHSPSCGYGKIYDGTFSGKLIDGNGVTAELLCRHGVNVIGESQIENFLSSQAIR